VQLWHGLILVIVVGGMLTVFYEYERRDRIAELDAVLQQKLVFALPLLAPPPLQGPQAEPGAKEERLKKLFSDDFYFLLNLGGEGRRESSENAPPEAVESLELIPPGTNRFRTRGSYREILHGVPRERTLTIGAPLASAMAGMDRLAWKLTGIGAAIVIVAWVGGWLLVGRALRPIDEITATARRITGGNLSERIAVGNADTELDRLGEVLNEMFGRLEADFEKEARLTSDLSHELRTPVSVLLSQTQLALMRDRSPEEYRETLETCQRNAHRMRELIESMLQLAGIDAGDHEWAFAPCDLATIAGGVADNLRPLAKEAGIELTVDLEPARCQADADAISQVITNLVSNAINHHRPADSGPRTIKIESHQNGAGAFLRVSDNGPGIDPADRAHLFERFYRGDKARSRKRGSSGLGLSISLAIVEAHKGMLKLRDRSEPGACFEMILPGA